MRETKKVLCIFVVITMLVCILSQTVFAAEPAEQNTSAVPTTSTVVVDGATVAFQAYNIDGYNYFKLRDLGKALSGSARQFEIGYDEATRSISVATGTDYTPVGGELAVMTDNAVKRAMVSAALVYIDGSQAKLSAYTIDGYNYFKLRDIAAAVDFGVNYNPDTREISIDTSRGYLTETTETVPAANPLLGAWYMSFGEGSPDSAVLIFGEDGTITQLLSNTVSTYSVDGGKFKETVKKDGSVSTYGYNISTENGQTILNIDANQYGKLIRVSEVPENEADTVVGLWQLTEGYNEGAYFYFTKDGRVLIGILLSGTYTISESGDSFNDNITSDGSVETTKFTITMAGGVTQMVMTDAEGRPSTITKE